MHATEAGYGASGGEGLARGLALVAVAVILGAILLFSFKGNGTTTVAATPGGGDTPTTKAPKPGKTTTTLTPPTTEQPLRLPADITVIALNASKTVGTGAKAATLASLAGYSKQLKTADATTALKASTKASLIYFAPGFEREAAALAAALNLATDAVQPLPTTAITAADIKTAELVIFAGPDIAARPKPTTTTAPKPTTTAKGTSTTKPKATTTTAKG